MSGTGNRRLGQPCSTPCLNVPSDSAKRGKRAQSFAEIRSNLFCSVLPNFLGRLSGFQIVVQEYYFLFHNRIDFEELCH